MARLSRTQRRVSYRARVSLAEPGGQVRIAGQAMNLSVAGMFVHAAGSCALGSDVVCDMPLPSGMCQVKGRVTRVQRLPDATGMAIQFVDLPAYQQAMLNDLIERSREPSIPLAVRFEGMSAPIQCRGIFFDDKLRLRTKVPFLRIGSHVQVSVDGSHDDLPASADLTGTLASVALRPSPLDGIPRLAIDLDVARAEVEGQEPNGPSPLEQAIADCVSSDDAGHTPTPSPVPLNSGRPPRRTPPELRFSSAMVSGELQPRNRTRTEEFEAQDTANTVSVTPGRASGGGAMAGGAANDTDSAGAPQARSARDDWAQTEAIPADDRRRASPGRRQPDQQPPSSSWAPRVLALSGIAALGLCVGVLLIRSDLPRQTSSSATTPSREGGHPASTTQAPASPTGSPRSTLTSGPAGAQVKPVIVPVTPAPPVAPATEPPPSKPVAAAKGPGPANSKLAGRTPAPVHRIARPSHPPPPLAFDPETKQYKLNGVTSFDLGGAKLTGITGFSGAPGANVRGINVTVESGTTRLHVTFHDPEGDGAYGVQVTPSWPTMSAISEKTAEGFTITFVAPAPDSATVDWLLVH
jgi:hypothetical protein